MSSKKRAWNWLFGRHAYVSFKTGSAQNISSSTQHDFNEGCDSVSSPTSGELLFYTNGNTIYGNDFQAKHFNISGGLDSQKAIQAITIVQEPGSDDEYFLFMVGDWTTSPSTVRPIRYRKYNPYSDTLGSIVTLDNEDSANAIGYAENLTAILKSNNTDYWIVTVKKGNDEMKLWTLSATGVSGPITRTIGFENTGGNRFGQLKASPDGKKLVLATGTTGGGSTETPTLVLWDFDDSEGNISNETHLIKWNEWDDARYPIGVDFSSNSQNIYCATDPYDVSATLYKFRLNANNARSFIVLDTKGGAVQRATDDKIYLATGGVEYLYVIDDPNDNTSSIVVTQFSLPEGVYCKLGLPVVPQIRIDEIKDYRVYRGGIWYSVCNGDDIRYYDSDTSSWNKLEPGDKYWNASLGIWEEIKCSVDPPPEPPPEPEYDYYDITGFYDPQSEGYPAWPADTYTLAKTASSTPVFTGDYATIVDSTKYDGSYNVIASIIDGADKNIIFQHTYTGDDSGRFAIEQ